VCDKIIGRHKNGAVESEQPASRKNLAKQESEAVLSLEKSIAKQNFFQALDLEN